MSEDTNNANDASNATAAASDPAKSDTPTKKPPPDTKPGKLPPLKLDPDHDIAEADPIQAQGKVVEIAEMEVAVYEIEGETRD